MQSNRRVDMKSKMFLAIFMMSALFAGGAVSHAAIAMQSATADYQTGDQSMAKTEGTTKRKKRSKAKKGAVDVEKGTKDTGKDIGKGSEKAGEGVARAGEKTGEGVAKGTEVGAKETATAGKDAAKDTAKGTRKAGKATAKGVKKVGSKL
jgi:hypothetical protein